jgi:hypothetical protein
VRSLWLSMLWLRATSRVGRPRTEQYLRGRGAATAARSIVVACSDSAGLLRARPAAYLVRGSIMGRLVCRATSQTNREGNRAETKATKRAHDGPAFQHSFLEWSLAVWQRGYVSTQGNCRMFASLLARSGAPGPPRRPDERTASVVEDASAPFASAQPSLDHHRQKQKCTTRQTLVGCAQRADLVDDIVDQSQ